MLDELIKEAATIENQSTLGVLGGKKYPDDQLSLWANSVVLYLEEFFPASELTQKAKAIISRGNYNSSDDFLQFKNSLHAAKRVLEAKQKEEQEWIDSFDDLNR
jgi:hypothetical protein